VTLGRWNEVRGTGGRWYYGLFVRHADGSVTVSAVRREDNETVKVERVSPYRTTSLARQMRDRRPGYEAAVRKAIRDAEH
jgi:hypothetical protein